MTDSPVSGFAIMLVRGYKTRPISRLDISRQSNQPSTFHHVLTHNINLPPTGVAVNEQSVPATLGGMVLEAIPSSYPEDQTTTEMNTRGGWGGTLFCSLLQYHNFPQNTTSPPYPGTPPSILFAGRSSTSIIVSGPTCFQFVFHKFYYPSALAAQ